MSGADHLPATARSWSAAQIGPGSRVIRARRLRGASASAVHALDIEDRTGHRHRLVLRRFVGPIAAAEPDLAAREATVLTLLHGHGTGAPGLVGVDPDGSAAGDRAVLTTRVPGRIELRPADPRRWVRELAAALGPIHAIDGGGLPPYARYDDGRWSGPPPWSRHPAAWERAAEIVDRGPTPAPHTMIHRDYHPLNTLWSRGRVTGVVDWASGCVGDPGVDVGHCRVNLAMLAGGDVADAFAPHADPYWDLASATDGLAWSLPTPSFRDAGRTDLDDRTVAERLDTFVATAVSRVARAAP
ncbi:MAG: phosphotransferase family protein [Acidimicrobiia bacterium]